MTQPIRTFKARRGRMRPQQRAALDLFDRHHFTTARLPSVDPMRTVALEIGFGTGEGTVAMASRNPDTQWIAVDVHTPGVAQLIRQCVAQECQNVFVVEADVFTILDQLPMLEQVHTYFPDPWPKSRHHKRRLITAARVADLSAHVRPGGSWFLATDWAEYAEVIADVFAASQWWEGGSIERPDRPVTNYERKAHAAGRMVTDFHFIRSAACPPPSEP